MKGDDAGRKKRSVAPLTLRKAGKRIPEREEEGLFKGSPKKEVRVRIYSSG